MAAYYSKIFRERGREASKKDGSSGALEALELLKHANLLYPQNSTRRDITHMLLQISRDKHPGSMFGSSSFKDLIDDWMETDDLAYEEILLVGLELHFDKSYERAMTIYQYIIESKRYEKLNQPFYKSEVHYNYGVTLQHYGDFNDANHQFLAAIAFNKFNLRAAINLAAIHHKYGDPNHATQYYKEATEVLEMKNLSFTWELESMARTNYGVNLLQQYQYDKANDQFLRVIHRLETLIQLNCLELDKKNVNNVDRDKLMKVCDDLSFARSFTLHKMYTVHKGCVYWKGWETMLETLVQDTVKFAIQYIEYWQKEINMKELYTEQHSTNNENIGQQRIIKTFDGPLLPFDTLQVEISLSRRMLIADTYALNYYQVDTYQHKIHQEIYKDTIPILKLGFLSYDFKEHPTARMIEGIFRHLPGEKRKDSQDVRDYIHTTIFSYSNHDDSDMIEISKNMADVFVDLAALSRLDATTEIRQHQLDILLDLQLFTLGHRAEIIAKRPVPLQLNYLIFPGTCGASFIDSLVADYIVVPAEHANTYTEKLLLVPTSYQISYYDRYSRVIDTSLKQPFMDSAKSLLRKENGLPTNPKAIVLCNFNKMDKLDPKTFNMWMNIMIRIPYSYLWLMNPGKDDERIQTNLIEVARYNGISKDRIVFAPRRDKASHIARHRAADLFVDTLIYGAHSTATDALRGGLPVITVHGDSFPNRVVASLYDSFRFEIGRHTTSLLDMLICNSAKEYEDLTIRLLSTSNNVLVAIQNQLNKLIRNKAGIFDAEKTTVNFIKAMMTSHEVRWGFGTKDKRFHTQISSLHQNLIHLNSSYSVIRPREKADSSLMKYHIIIPSS